MTIRVTCPGCKTSLTLDEKVRGKKVRCRECEKVLSIPAANGKPKPAVPLPEDEEMDEKPRKKTTSNEEADDEETPPARKKKKKKKAKQSSPALLLGIVALVAILLVGGGLSAFFLFRSDDAAAKDKADLLAKNEQRKLEMEQKKKEMQNKDAGFRFVPKMEEGNIVKKAGAGNIIQNVRGMGYITERKGDLKSIGIYYAIYFNDHPNPNSRKLEEFLDSFKRDAKNVYDACKTQDYYRVNLKAQLTADSIIAYERDMYPQGYLSVRGDGSVDFVPQAEWKTALGMP